MSFSDAAEAAILNLLFLNTDYANVGDAAGLQNSATAGSLYVALHTADPTDAGAQNASECAYTSYARVAVARSGAGWTLATSTMSNAAAVTFPTATGGSETATYFSIGLESSGATQILVSDVLTASRAISSGVTPTFEIGDLTTTLA